MAEPGRTFSVGAALRESVALAGAARSPAAAAGALLTLAAALLWAWPPSMAEGETLPEIWRLTLDYLRVNWPWLLLQILIDMAATLVFLRAVLVRGAGAGAAAAAGLRSLPIYAAASLVAWILILAGLVLLLAPGLYVAARLAPLAAVVAAEPRQGPLDAILRTFDLTRGHGWQIFLYLLVAGLPLFLLAALTPPSGVVGGFVGAALRLTTLLVLAGLYRHLSLPAPTPAPTSGT